MTLAIPRSVRQLARRPTGAWPDLQRIHRVGKLLAAQTAPRFTHNVLELGGNAPFVVLEDAGLDRAVDLLATAKYRNNGQSCIAAQVWVLHRLVDTFADAFAKVTDELVLGEPLDPSTTLGPLALSSDPGRIDEVAQDAAASGATVVTSKTEQPTNGYFARPVLCIEPNADSRAATEEIFGPMASLRGYQDVDDVITATRADQYGLGGYVVSDPTNAAALAQALDVGIAGVNNVSPNTPLVPFGGLKHSGLGWERRPSRPRRVPDPAHNSGRDLTMTWL